MSSITKQKGSNLDKPLGKGKAEVNVATFALLFSEIVQYCQNRVYSVTELQNKLAEMGQHVGSHLLDLLFVREKGYKREIKLLNMLLFIKNSFWKTLFGKEADRLEHSNDDERTCKLNCAAFTAGIIEAPAKVTAHWHKGTTFMIEFDDSVIARDKVVEGK
ncbi:hypothetical protein KUTeg_016015 [Tegillarca granosa]|uniref:Trafficking protein particle complex subunit 5 n=1 Tax=Tegillarca granosa TaxID=220873 RepID=A0ABQ9EPG7_TEGGR|nr:hypothetical protein KUTeg_016015 [Tegillarca granosa]